MFPNIVRKSLSKRSLNFLITLLSLISLFQGIQLFFIEPSQSAYANTGADTASAATGPRIYKVNPTGFVCGTTSPTQGIAKLRLFPDDTNRNIRVEIRKCDNGQFSKRGQAYLTVNGTRRYGPYSYNQGASGVDFTIDPVRENIFGKNTYQAEVVPFDQNDPILSGSVTAEAYFSTTITAKKNGATWNEVGIWYASTSGSPSGNGFYQTFLPEGVGNWNFYVEKKNGHRVSANHSYTEETNHYRFNIPTGTEVVINYVQETTTPASAILQGNDLTAACQWTIVMKLSGFTPNSQITTNSNYNETRCDTGQQGSGSWTAVYNSPVGANGELLVTYTHFGTGSYRYTFTDNAGKSATLAFETTAPSQPSVEPFDETPQTTAQFAQRCLDEINVAGVGLGATGYNISEFQGTDYVDITAEDVKAAICDAYRRNRDHIGSPVSGGNGSVHWWLNSQGAKSKYQAQNFCRKDANGNIESDGNGGCRDDIIIYNPVVRTAFLVRDQVWDKYRSSSSGGGYDGVLGKLGGPVTDVLNVRLDASKNPMRYEASGDKNDLIGYFEQGELVFEASNGQLLDRTPDINVYPYLNYRDVTIAHPFGWYVGQLTNGLTQSSILQASTSSQEQSPNAILVPSEENEGGTSNQLLGIDHNVSRGTFALWVANYIYGSNLPPLTGNCPNPANTDCFADIPVADKDKPEVKAIYMLENDEIIRGTTEQNRRYVHPNSQITRGEAMSIVMRALMHPLGIPDYNDINPFSDIKIGDKHGLAILNGYRFGIIGGYSDGTFKPDKPLTFGAAAKILCKAFANCYDPNDSEDLEKKRIRDSEGWSYTGPGMKLRTIYPEPNNNSIRVFISAIALGTPGIQVEISHEFAENGEANGEFKRKQIKDLVPQSVSNNNPFVAINGTKFECSGTASQDDILGIHGIPYMTSQGNIGSVRIEDGIKKGGICSSFFTYDPDSLLNTKIHRPNTIGEIDAEGFPWACRNDLIDFDAWLAENTAQNYIRSQIESTTFAIGAGPTIIRNGGLVDNLNDFEDYKNQRNTVLGLSYMKYTEQGNMGGAEYLYLSTAPQSVALRDFAEYLDEAGADDAILLDGGGSSQFYSGSIYSKVNEPGCIDDVLSPNSPRKIINSVVAYNDLTINAEQHQINNTVEAEMRYLNQVLMKFAPNSFGVTNLSKQMSQGSQIYTIQYMVRPQVIDAAPTLQGTESAYDLSAWDVNSQPAQLLNAYTVHILYDSGALPTNVDENNLALYYWDGTQWQKEPTSTVNVDANQITATPQRLGSWAVLAEVEAPSGGGNVYLPLVTK